MNVIETFDHVHRVTKGRAGPQLISILVDVNRLIHFNEDMRDYAKNDFYIFVPHNYILSEQQM